MSDKQIWNYFSLFIPPPKKNKTTDISTLTRVLIKFEDVVYFYCSHAELVLMSSYFPVTANCLKQVEMSASLISRVAISLTNVKCSLLPVDFSPGQRQLEISRVNSGIELAELRRWLLHVCSISVRSKWQNVINYLLKKLWWARSVDGSGQEWKECWLWFPAT